MTNPPDQKPHVVIVGAGFAGIYAAKALAKAPVRSPSWTRHNHHLFQPMLYQVRRRAGTLDIAVPDSIHLRHNMNTEVLLGEALASSNSRDGAAWSDKSSFPLRLPGKASAGTGGDCRRSKTVTRTGALAKALAA